MFIKFILFIFFSIILSIGNCQSLDSLSLLINGIQKGENDSIRFASNKKFKESFEKCLLQKGSFERNFDSLRNVSVQTSDDNKFRIYTWVLPRYDGNEYVYFGFIQIHTFSVDRLIELTDSTHAIKKPESEKLPPEKWLGAVYYDIVTIKKSGSNYYTLLGWKGKNEKETQKIIEVLYFDEMKARFGFPIIKVGTVFRNRMVFTFNAQATMTLRYEEKYNGIVFDHFSVNKNIPESLPGPDGTYDMLKIKKGKWMLYRDVKIEN